MGKEIKETYLPVPYSTIEQCRQICRQVENSIVLTPQGNNQSYFHVSPGIQRLLQNARYLNVIVNWEKELLLLMPVTAFDNWNLSLNPDEEGMCYIHADVFVNSFYFKLGWEDGFPRLLHGIVDQQYGPNAVLIDLAQAEALTADRLAAAEAKSSEVSA